MDILVFATVVLPFLAAIALLLLRDKGSRGLIVVGTAVVLAAASLALVGQGAFEYAPKSILGISLDGLITLLDFALLFVILVIAMTKLKNPLVAALTAIQIVGLIYLEFFMMDHGAAKAAPAMFADSLSMIMVLVISIVGSLICVYALGYMPAHEDHLHLARTKQPRFFFYLVAFLGAMNGLVLANSLMWLYFFWEVTTFCSFMLISHDGDETSVKNATRALWMNMTGGVAFVFALIFLQKTGTGLYLSELLKPGFSAAGAAALIPLFMLCYAGITKSAQVPFQSWLTGAMVAPTPVSALLHSSTMVKAGVYLVLRLAPAYSGTMLSGTLAMFGAFTFLTTSALAVGQSNAKKVLAYSTIANLGLIIACAGINTPAAITAAIVIIIFHAVSKALMFLCVGTIEQKIHSRDLENMRGLYMIMPKTTIVALIGVVTMLLPPFGVLMGKWMAIESAAAMKYMPVTVMLALGSGLTVMFWARWAGILLSTPYPKGIPAEPQPGTVRGPLVLLAAGAVLLSLFVPFLYGGLIEPAVRSSHKAAGFVLDAFNFVNQQGVFYIYPLFLVLGVGFYFAWKQARKVEAADCVGPYLCGAQSTGDDKAFVSTAGANVGYQASNFYLTWLFGEERLTGPINMVSGVLLAVMLGLLLGGVI
ncbi:NADH-quinone oxidoreductase subunit L [Fundidesulfovibrio soli]|uniref:NADH-quinone oxidoreductase subunit 5 family protein n=1 Tax=Fundidesulfovibrio soli TaxID=2922716 RepID=UPI001FAF6C6C|nr:proton-conducting transporter membrane subunit [Fundidesulfovibrio soli]